VGSLLFEREKISTPEKHVEKKNKEFFLVNVSI